MAPALEAAQPRAYGRLAVRILAGAAVLLLVVWYAHPATLWIELQRTNVMLFVLAVLVSMASNILSAMRWGVIARGLALIAPTSRLILMYARAMTTNMLLPGATLSGDLLRSVQLSRLGNPFMPCALSVFLDRFSGLWILCVLSLLSAGGVVAWALLTQTPGRIAADRMALYLLVLGSIAVAPLIPLPFDRLQHSRARWIAALATRWAQLRSRLQQARPALVASVWQSLGVQLLSAAALWICALAVGVSLSYPVMLAAAAPIFIMAALPIGVAGFGTRELAAVIVLGFAGVPSGQAIATALLYGISAVVQGIVAAPLFFSKP